MLLYQQVNVLTYLVLFSSIMGLYKVQKIYMFIYCCYGFADLDIIHVRQAR